MSHKKIAIDSRIIAYWTENKDQDYDTAMRLTADAAQVSIDRVIEALFRHQLKVGQANIVSES